MEDGEEENRCVETALSKSDNARRSASRIWIFGSIQLAEAIHKNVGTGDCDDDQLAAWTGQSPKSSNFRAQVYSARTFGLLEGDGRRHKQTELGRAIVDPAKCGRRRLGHSLACRDTGRYSKVTRVVFFDQPMRSS